MHVHTHVCTSAMTRRDALAGERHSIEIQDAVWHERQRTVWCWTIEPNGREVGAIQTRSSAATQIRTDQGECGQTERQDTAGIVCFMHQSRKYAEEYKYLRTYNECHTPQGHEAPMAKCSAFQFFSGYAHAFGRLLLELTQKLPHGHIRAARYTYTRTYIPGWNPYAGKVAQT